MIYFAAHAGRIKVGFTARDAQKRITEIAAHYVEPVTLLGHVEGGRALERKLHGELAPYHIKGEWFRDCEDVRRILAAVKDSPDDAAPERTPDTKPAVNPESFVRIARLLWPNDTIRQLSAFSEMPEATCKDWLEGISRPPFLIRAAFAAHVVRWMVV